MSEISSQLGLRAEDQLTEIKQQLEAQKKRYEKLKFKHSGAGEAMYELRQIFQTYLNKLNNLDTRDSASRELRQLIDKNSSSEALKIYLSTLGELKKVRSPGAREQEVLLIGFIAQVYGERLIENEGSLKILIKVLDLIKDFYGDLARSVHEAAASAFCDLYVHCMPKGDVDNAISFFFEPLENSMTSGVNVKTQQAASLSVFKWSMVLVQEENEHVLLAICPRIVTLYVKLRTDFPDLISALGVIVDYQGVHSIIPEIHYILKKTLQYLNTTGTGTHLYKIEACKLLSCLAKKLQGIADVVIEPYHNEIIYVLQQVKTDKLQSVQNAAKQALTDWKNLEDIQKEIESKKMEEQIPINDDIQKFSSKNRDSSPLRIGPNNFKAIRELAKRNKKPTDNWGLAKPKYLEKGSGNYSVSPHNSRENFRKSREEGFYPSAIVPKDGVNKHVLEVIQKKSYEARARDEILYESDSPEPVKEVFVKHLPKRENLNVLSQKIRDTFKSMENAMDQGFTQIENRLQDLDGRMDGAYDKLQNAANRPVVPSFIHPPRVETATVFTQTQNNVEIQAKMSQSSLSTPGGIGSTRALDILSQAWVEVLQWVNEGNLEEAYRRVLLTGDDIYLLRLMHKTGVCIKHLNSETCKAILQRLGMILNSNFLEILGMNWISESLEERIFGKLSPDDKETIIEAIQRYSALPGEEGDQAAEILNNLKY